MKFLVTVTPGPMPPPVELVRTSRDWIQARINEGTFEAVYAFPGGGGVSIGEYDSHEQVMEELMDYPLSPFVEYDVKPLVDLDAAFDRLIPFIEKMSEQMAAQSS